jgi:hypothetical protein
MIHQEEIQNTALLEAQTNPALENLAVAHCDAVRKAVYEATAKRTRNSYTASKMASEAFRAALPPLDCRQNLPDFIACVSYGMATGLINDKVGSKLLYAAQTANSILPKYDTYRSIPYPLSLTPPPISTQPNE